MGNSGSHEEDGVSTPKPEASSRILSIDPRSPTVDITRTPIVVNKTPENALHDLLDPRSPTVDIVRTPLSGLPCSKLATATSENVAVHTQYDFNEGEQNCDCEDADDLTKNLLDPLGVTGIEDLSLEDFHTSESTQLVPIEQQMLDVTDKIRLKKKKPKAAQRKELFPVKKSVATKDNTRSPLSTRTIDMNSPARLVQRKQMKDFDRKMTCSLENSSSQYIVREKENM